MKNYFKLIIIALVAGFSGAYIHNRVNPNKETIYYESTDRMSRNFASLHHAQMTEVNKDFVSASALSTQSVVYIKTSSTHHNQISWFDMFFNHGGGSQQVSGSGSGVIYTSDGFIITNNHVIDKAEKIEVVHDKRTYEAKVVGRDLSTDLALLKVEAVNLPAIKMGSSHEVNIGEWVLAVGNPFNLTSTVTAGIVSAKARNINVLNSAFPIESFIQTDAAINPGNSGGALVNLKGELIGINTAILSKTGSYSGYGFAVPSDIVRKVVKDLINFGEVQKAFLGAEVSDINQETINQHGLDISDYNGVAVVFLQKDGSAEKIGLKKGDVIIKINEFEVNSKATFDEFLSYFTPGDKIKILYKRDDRIKEAQVVLTNREGTTEILKREIYTAESIGADLEALSKVEKDKLGITGGVRIVKVKNGLIRRLGISEGFVITGINQIAIQYPEEVVEILEKVRGKVLIEGITNNGVKGYYSYYF
ncbi:MAG: S1C family serine protease [Cytophagaceae bacterium]